MILLQIIKYIHNCIFTLHKPLIFDLEFKSVSLKAVNGVPRFFPDKSLRGEYKFLFHLTKKQKRKIKISEIW